MINKKLLPTAIYFTIVVVMVLDVIPPDTLQFPKWKISLTRVLSRVGLWQGQWSMFAPDPVLNNAWFEAELIASDGKIASWTSPSWNEVSNRDKFWRFREMNYFNRIHLGMNRPAIDDLGKWIGREQTDIDAVEWRIYRNSMQPVFDPNEPLPRREDTVSVFRSDLLMEHRAAP